MKHFYIFIILYLCISPIVAQRADYRIIPQPKSVEVDTTQVFTLRDGMAIAYDAANDEVARNAQFLQQWVQEATGLRLRLAPADKQKVTGKQVAGKLASADKQVAIRFVLEQPTARKAKKSKKTSVAAEPTEQELEAYTLTVNAQGIILSARQPVGLFRAAQTLRKSLPLNPNPSSPTSSTFNFPLGPQGRLTLQELSTFNSIDLPFATISDQPRFSYRGVLLDCARHFFTVDVIKQLLDVLALHGCNQFHWHLTEDQGWRFEVKALPDLAIKGSVREKTVIGPGNMRIYDNIPYGGYYTQEDCREVVRYAAERYINVVPEIDMPGHMMSALHVFPNLGCTGGPYPVAPHWGVMRDVLCGGNPETLTFLKTAFGELCEVFPSKFIHIGGDECPKERWQKCEKCQAKIRELGLTNEPKVNVGDGRGSQDGRSAENKLQTYLNHEIEQFLASRGRSLIGWDEILSGGLTENAIVMSWRGTKGGIEAARQKHRVIMSPNVYAYIDHPQLKDYGKQPRTTDSYLVSCSKIYSFEPVVPEELTDEEQNCILGVQANLWTEQVAFPEHMFYQLLPRLASMSEVQWCRPDQKDFENFKARLPRLQQFYDRLGVPYCHQVE